MVEIGIPAFKLMCQELMAMNIAPRLIVAAGDGSQNLRPRVKTAPPRMKSENSSAEICLEPFMAAARTRRREAAWTRACRKY